ncbi:MAG: GspH/FimT family pseudopilin [Candidatus Margulisbacteria bacterium]|nr:GspH/FimT family pseudopilin [Candidatus Margulisiibacteriota bacterium]
MKKRRSFSLVEIIIVMAIIGIISIGAFVLIAPYKTLKLDAAAKKIAADLQYARNLALTTSEWYGVSFNTDPTNSYTVYKTDGTIDTITEDPSRLGKNFIVNLNEIYKGVILKSVDISGGRQIEFHPLGKPYDDHNGLAITATGTISVEYSGSAKTIIITPNTGEISIQ